MIILDRRIPFVSAALDERIDQAVAILQAEEQRHGLRWINVTFNAAREDNRDEWYESHLWPFLSATHFVLTAGDLFPAGWQLMDSAGVNHTPSWRQWGGLLADWANQNWFVRPSGHGITERSKAERPWEYLDFYMAGYVSDLIDGYAKWRAAILQILEAK